MSATCFHCDAAVEVRDRIGRRDTCSQCGSDLHCCRNCDYYDPTMHNQCREPQAERQVDKERGNFCEYFSLRVSARPAAPGSNARARLDALFRPKVRS